jgi:hypothetical protein
MNTKNLLIAALARNCEDSLKVNIPLIEKLRAQFTWSEVVVVENDSIDGTKDLLNDWKINCTNVTIISNDYGTKTIPDKSDLIANALIKWFLLETFIWIISNKLNTQLI